ncbi:UPF0272 protein [Synergistales bacterium]|nr:UPF0272 protein [Synergistales bacterium]
MKTLYFDCFAGISGDMLVGALFALSPDLNAFKAELAKMTAFNSDDYSVSFEESAKNGITGTHFKVHTHEHHPHRGLHDIEGIIMSSSLSERIKRETMRAFALLADAEARVHGTTPDKIHFHEVGAVDSILDIVGTYILIDKLGWPRVLCSPINVGSGTVQCAHGVLPVPAPATEILLRNVPIYSNGSPMERTTPTGALLAKCLADAFSPLPGGVIVTSSYGLGTRDSDIPNVLRVLLMESAPKEPEGFERDRVASLAANIDDMNPQDFALVCERLFEAGALDVWCESIFMKKGRPGVKLSCLCESESADALSKLMLKNTTTQGVRRSTLDRVKLCYKIEKISTSLGELNVKTAYLDGEPLRSTPEYEDVKRIAVARGLSMPEVRSVIQNLNL